MNVSFTGKITEEEILGLVQKHLQAVLTTSLPGEFVIDPPLSYQYFKDGLKFHLVLRDVNPNTLVDPDTLPSAHYEPDI